MSRLRATIRAPGVEFRLSQSRGPAGPRIDLLDLAGCLGAADGLRIRARAPIRGRMDGDHLDLPVGAQASALPDRGSLALDLDLSLAGGEPAVDRLDLRVEPAPARLVASETFADPVLAHLTSVPFRSILLEARDDDRARLVVTGETDDAPEIDLEVPRRLVAWSDGDGGEALPWGALRTGLLGLLDGGTIEIDAGALGHLVLDLESGDGGVVDAAEEDVLSLPAMSVDLSLTAGRYAVGAFEPPTVRGPLRLKARLGPSTVPIPGRPGRATGRVDVTALEVTGALGMLEGEARVDLEGRGRVIVIRANRAISYRLSGVILRSEGLRLGLDGVPGTDLKVDFAASPASMTLGWLGAEFAVKAERVTAPVCTVTGGRLRLGRAARFEQLRIAFRSPLQAGGLYASGAAAMDELEASGEFGPGVARLDPLKVQGLRPSISLAYERTGSAAEAAVTMGGLLAGHTSLEGLVAVTGSDLAIVVSAAAADEGIRLEGGEMEIHAPGLDAQASVETGPLQPERIEFRRGAEGSSLHLRLRRTVVGVREVSADVAGAAGAFRGEGTAELGGLEVDLDGAGLRVASAGAGLSLRLHGEGVLRMGDTTIRLDRERATTVRVRGEVVWGADGRTVFRTEGAEVQARLGRSEWVRPGRAGEAAPRSLPRALREA